MTFPPAVVVQTVDPSAAVVVVVVVAAVLAVDDGWTCFFAENKFNVRLGSVKNFC